MQINGLSPNFSKRTLTTQALLDEAVRRNRRSPEDTLLDAMLKVEADFHSRKIADAFKPSKAERPVKQRELNFLTKRGAPRLLRKLGLKS